jgi:hypothetical protein
MGVALTGQGDKGGSSNKVPNKERRELGRGSPPASQPLDELRLREYFSPNVRMDFVKDVGGH